jgi:hypothetical protein
MRRISFQPLLPGGTGHEMRALPSERRLFIQIEGYSGLSQEKCPQASTMSFLAAMV